MGIRKHVWPLAAKPIFHLQELVNLCVRSGEFMVFLTNAFTSAHGLRNEIVRRFSGRKGVQSRFELP
jgi:hypothetical protein